jgi:hypothetical protein
VPRKDLLEISERAPQPDGAPVSPPQAPARAHRRAALATGLALATALVYAQVRGRVEAALREAAAARSRGREGDAREWHARAREWRDDAAP